MGNGQWAMGNGQWAMGNGQGELLDINSRFKSFVKKYIRVIFIVGSNDYIVGANGYSPLLD